MSRTAPGRAARPAGLDRRLPFDIVPALSLVGLLIVGAVTITLLGGSIPVIGPGAGGVGGAIRTPTPSGVVVVDPRADVPGSLLYVKDGNVWVQTGSQARQLTTSGHNSMPAWSPDGSSVYFVRTDRKTGRWPSGGVIRQYDLAVPSLMRLSASGAGQPEVLLSGLVQRGNDTWSSFLREPAISPDGSTAAIITDGPDPTGSDIVLKLLNLTSKELTNPRLAESQPLGHSGPAWSPDGSSLLYVRNAREGTRGTPAIERYDVAKDKSTALTGPGYMSPSWSRDGRYVAATKTSSLGTDIVILDAKTGTELLRVTHDDNSFSPVWSPKGDAIAFLRVDHGVVDLYLVPLTGAAPSWTVGEPLALTVAAGLEALSRPAWFIPAGQLPPMPSPTATP